MDLEQAQQAELAPLPFRFTGNGSEYFRIWIVNLLLTVLTLGIYGAWAKVRRLKYFYGSTELAGARFDYHGDPLVILKGRLFAIGLFLVYTAATNVISIWSLVALVFLAIVLPWLLRNSFRFRMRNSSYRGLRFGFDGSVGAAYETFLLHPFIMFFTLYLAGPLFHARLKQYQHGNSRYGTARFGFSANVGDFYGAYGLIMVLFFGAMMLSIFAMIGVIAAAAVTGGEDGPNPEMIAAATGIVFLGIIGSTILLTPLWIARIQNLVWNHTTLDEHRFSSEIKVWPLLVIMLGNFFLIMLTLGLYSPWAAVRVARYRVESMAMLPAGDIDAFVASEAEAVSAMGEETTEVFDFDIGL